MHKKLSVKITINNNETILSTGSGCLYNPGFKDYMYVLTAKHCLVGKKGELRDVLSKDYIKIQRHEHINEAIYLDIIDYFLYPNDEHDLAIVLIKPISDVPAVKVGVVKDDLVGKFYGFPSPMPNGVGIDFKITDKLLNMQTEQFQIRTDDNLDTYLSSAAINCQGFSGSGAYTNDEGNTVLLGLITELASKEAAFSRLNAERAIKFNDILEIKQLPKLEVITLKSPIEIQLDTYLPQFNVRLARIKHAEHKELIETSKKEVYETLINMDQAELKSFLSKYYHPRVGYGKEVNTSQGIGELWELITYINCNSQKWQLLSYDISNLEITYEDSKEFINLIYSLEKFSIPFITLQLGIELAFSPFKKLIFDNLWVIDNFQNVYEDENICVNCGSGNNYPFENLLRDFSELQESGLLKGVDPENNTFKELGNINILCANCIRKLGAKFFIRKNQLVDKEEAKQ